MIGVENFRLLLKTRFYLDLDETFIISSFKQNLIFFFFFVKFGFSCLFGNENFCLFHDIKLVGSSSLSGNDNLYMLDIIASFNESYN